MNKKFIKITIIAMFLCFVLQMGFVAFSTVYSDTNTTQNTSTTTVSIPDDIKSIINAFDEDNYQRNLDNYKNLLIDLDISQIFQDEIERLLRKGNKLPDVLSAYEFLYQQ